MSDSWKLQDAKARFSELVRLASSEGPQRVTVRGKTSVVVVSAEEYERLRRRRPKTSLVEFLRSTSLDKIKIERDRDTGRDIEF
jgi:antitoxin Phd